MDKKLIINHQLLDIILSRLCHELIENYGDFEDTVLIGLQPKGIRVAQRLHQRLNDMCAQNVPLGFLDVTFYRDDFRRRSSVLKANETRIDFIIENKNVILIDDVLYTGRTVRAALDAMTAFGRPRKVELLTLIDRRYTRDLPIAPNYVGKQVNTLHSQRVLVEWDTAYGNQVWLLAQGLETDKGGV
ncbi:bifunctional pyr operon transcriptional regulator/uracil phosphoribosyltransferase PyrR [Eisenibacter elegans]|jgi:pyrimidine operon attenuation protein/uracil phosphoribosyltransferase|uniref:bifunctional pyr operon transcriptional regulator/uracil phosphoribosyltransferase PyrR n=1 Tax=Eisenibacter elegans TaxID=997 RepID=UPI0004054D29|nr:bifunctional pyr operon transcriptional regulator/uracil phosphoribosyltransferase PyrR [Eisenibacter elegans]